MDSKSPSYRKTYTPEQLQVYYERIKLPQDPRDKNVSRIARTKEGLLFLSTLQKYQLAAVPFENLDLHYSTHHSITLDPEHLFHKIVERNNGRGGYCMENSGLFATVLRSLGFDIMTTGARVNEAIEPVSAKEGWAGPRYGGWNHMIILVAIEGMKYLVDVGNGSTGSVSPLPLIHAEISQNIGPQEKRLVYESIPDLTDSSQKFWIYQHRNATDLPWIPTYCFQETEFLHNDYTVMNYYTSTNRASFFTFHVICTKLIMEDGVIVGNVTLFNGEVKKRILGKTTVLAILTSEAERIEALEKYFGLRLSRAEREGIKGMVTEI